MKNKKVLLIIPAYNEEKSILTVYNNIKAYNKKHGTKFDIIVINDGSTDDTELILQKNKIKHIKLINNLGIGGAVQTGYKYAFEKKYDVAVQFDGDNQHDVNYISKLIKPIIDMQANMVVGSRFVNDSTSKFKSSFFRRIGIHIISKVIKFKTGKVIYDTTSGFRAVDMYTLKLFANSYPVEYPEPISTVEAIKNGMNVVEVGVCMNERLGGTSSIKSWKSAYYMVNVILSILLSEKRRKKNVR